MELWEILFIIGVIIFVATVFGIRIYRRLKHKPLDECACCHKDKNKLLKEYHKKYRKKNSGCSCCN